MGPQRVAAVLTAGLAEGSPQAFGFAQLARPHLQTNERREGALSWTTGGAAAQDRLLQLAERLQAVAHSFGHHHLHPAFHQRQERLQRRQGVLLLRSVLTHEDPRGEDLLHGRGVGGIDAGHRLLDAFGVHGDAASVGVHSGGHARAQPRNMGEQALVGGFAQSQEHHRVALGNTQALTEGADVARQQGWATVIGQRDPHVRGRQHLAGQTGKALGGLHGEHGRAHLLGHTHERAQHRGDLSGQALRKSGDAGQAAFTGAGEQGAHRTLHALGDRVDDLLPRRQGGLQPLTARPGRGATASGGELRGAVEPDLGEVHRGFGGRALSVGDAGVALGHQQLAGCVVGQLPVHRPGSRTRAGHRALHHRTELLEHLADLAHVESGTLIFVAIIVGVARGETEGEVSAHCVLLGRARGAGRRPSCLTSWRAMPQRYPRSARPGYWHRHALGERPALGASVVTYGHGCDRLAADSADCGDRRHDLDRRPGPQGTAPGRRTLARPTPC